MSADQLHDGQRAAAIRAEVGDRQLSHLVQAMRADADFLDKIGQIAGANLTRSSADILEDTLNYTRGIQR